MAAFELLGKLFEQSIPSDNDLRTIIENSLYNLARLFLKLEYVSNMQIKLLQRIAFHRILNNTTLMMKFQCNACSTQQIWKITFP